MKIFSVAGVQAAGQAPLKNIAPETCIEIMTGAIVPQPFDCVIPIEQVKIDGPQVEIDPEYKAQSGSHIVRQASQYQHGQVLVSRGNRIDPLTVAVAATVGQRVCTVKKMPRVAVISTGDELKEIDADVKEYEIRKSNSYFMQTMLNDWWFADASVFHFGDDETALSQGLKKIIQEFDVLVLTGGVSMGKFDLVPKILTQCGITGLFHKVKQRPGKPLWVGKSESGQMVFGLPGNPVSTSVCLRRYVIPYLQHCLTLKVREENICLIQDHEIKTQFTCFLPVKIIDQPNAQMMAEPLTIKGSSDVVTLAHSDGFIEIPPNTSIVRKGEVFSYFPWSCQL